MKYLDADGLQVKVDDADYDSLCMYTWHIKPRTPSHLYVYRYEKRSATDPAISRYRKVLLHCQLMGFPTLSVDHRNGDTLDNRRSNLRLATQQQQAQNTRHRNGKQYKGVSCQLLIHGKYECHVPWKARIRVNGKLIALGHFATPREAAIAYNQAAQEHFGEFAALNDVSSEVVK